MAHRLSRAAVADLDGIWDYTAEHWGVTQAELVTADLTSWKPHRDGQGQN